MTRKTCLITGANSGIGKEAAVQIAKKGFHVIMACRNKERGSKALEEVKQRSGSEEVEVIIMDMASQENIRKVSTDLHEKYKTLDVVIHNAAAFDISSKTPVFTTEEIELVWATNHVGPVLFNELNIDLIKASEQGRILTISSKGLLVKGGLKINFEDPNLRGGKYNVVNAYYQSKLAQVFYTQWLADQLKETDVTANCIRVTNVKIDISRYPNIPGYMKRMYAIKSKFSITPAKMAKTYTYLATDETVSQISGIHFNEKNKAVKYTKYQADKKLQEKLYNMTKSYFRH